MSDRRDVARLAADTARYIVSVELNRLEDQIAKARQNLGRPAPGAPLILPPGSGSALQRRQHPPAPYVAKAARLRKTLVRDDIDPELKRAYRELAVRDGLTELASIEPTRVDGVGTPANGFPILMMKDIGVGFPGASGNAATARNQKQQARAETVARLRRIARETSDPDVRSSHLELASEIERGARNP